jgi:hypothetical protein
MNGMDLGSIPVVDRIAMMTRGVSSGPAALMSPEQWMLWTGVLMPE